MSRPPAWETTTLGEACEKPQYGFTASAETRDTGTRFLRITDLREGDIKWNEVPFCTCRENEIGRYQLKTGDLVVARIGATTGRTSLAVSPPKAVFASYLIRLRPNADINPFFLYFFTQSSAYWSSINSSKDSNLKGGVNAGLLARIEIPKPLRSEQEKIAAVLWKIQKAVEIEDAIVRNARDLKKSLLRRLFTHGLRGERLKETEIGPLPESWDVQPLSECAHVQTGVAKGRPINPSDLIEVPYLRVANVQHGHLDLSEMKKIQIRRNELARYSLRKDDVVVTEGGDFDKLGRGFIWDGQIDPCVHQNHIFAVRPHRDRLLPRYLAYLVQSPHGRGYFLTVAHKTTNLACINTSKLKALPVLLPPLGDQEKIAGILQTIDQKIDIHESKKRSLEDLFKTTLHKLMTAQIRVNDLDIGTSEVGVVQQEGKKG